MTPVSREAVISALSKLHAPGAGHDIVATGLVSEIVIKDGSVMFALVADSHHAKSMEPLRRSAEEAVRRLPGVEKVMVALTAERGPATRQSPEASPRGQNLPGITHIIAVASGKGGVGKSTTAVNLALGLSNLGLSIGILDADIYGPSMQRLLGIWEKPRMTAPGPNTMQPLERHGLRAMSMGFMVDEATPIVWRGPMVGRALMQMLRDVAWGKLDVLVVDMPPGTGDIQLSLAQQCPLSGVVIVSTPQDLALVDARKGLAMFQRVNVPVLGIVENMSYFVCTRCGERHEIFGHGGALEEAQRLGVPFLGEVPLDSHVRASSDAGEPVTAKEPNSLHASIYRDIASKVWSALQHGEHARPLPRIVIEG
jgi:ATP-binding protein involved in chromosome partitioning